VLVLGLFFGGVGGGVVGLGGGVLGVGGWVFVSQDAPPASSLPLPLSFEYSGLFRSFKAYHSRCSPPLMTGGRLYIPLLDSLESLAFVLLG